MESIPAGGGATPATVGVVPTASAGWEERGGKSGCLSSVAGRWRVWTVNTSLGWISPLTYLRPWYKG